MDIRSATAAAARAAKARFDDAMKKVAQGAKNVGRQRVSDAQAEEVSRGLVTMPDATRMRILDHLSDHKLAYGTVGTVGGLLALNSTDMGREILTWPIEQVEELLKLFDAIDSAAGDGVASVYNATNKFRNSNVFGDTDGESRLGVPLHEQESGIPWADLTPDERQSMTLQHRSLLQSLSTDDLFWLMFLTKNASAEDLQRLKDEVDFIKRY